jgi:signal transduction histidine kinase
MTPVSEPVYILLVDDLQENLDALDALLRREDLVLLKVRSGPEALELLLKHEVALALLDVQMPGMDGFELAELMRGIERTKVVPIIFLTAGTSDQQRRFRGYEAGAVDFLQKPIEPDILKSKVSVFFELHRQRQEIGRLLQESRQYADALQEADRRKDEFLATLAHELRNPLAPLRNGLEVMKLAHNSNENQSGGQVLAMMERQLAQMVRLIDDLLDVSRISRGRIELLREHVELAQVLNDAVETTRPLIEQAGHALNISIPSGPIYVDADLTRLSQVFSNLLNNAAKFTEPGGRIELTVARQGDEVAVTVSDNGVGIPADMLPKIFELFTQEDRSLEKSRGGLGIGLSLVKRLVEMHNGTIEVSSEGHGRGSKFVVHLPPAQSPNGPQTGNDATEQAGHHPARHRILIADDNKDAATSLAMILNIMGNETQAVYDGLAAFNAAPVFKPDVILLDIGMPELNGYDAARRIREQPWGRDIVLVALTGWGQDEDKRQSLAAGFNFHMVKPIDLANLEKLLAGLDTLPHGSAGSLQS